MLFSHLKSVFYFEIMSFLLFFFGTLFIYLLFIYLFKNFFINVFILFLRVQAGEGQREGETQNLKQAPGSELSAQNPTWGSNP